MELLISARAQENGTVNSARCSLDVAGVTLGRGPESQVPLDGTGISREHLRLHAEGEGIFVTDLSSNGTWVNAQRLKRGQQQAIAPEDAIGIPGFEIRIELQDTSAVLAQPVTAEKQMNLDTAAQPVKSAGPFAALQALATSLSTVERFLIALALATFALVAIYLAA